MTYIIVIHTETYGWLDWAKNGEIAGTTGCAKRLRMYTGCSGKKRCGGTR